MTQQPPAMTPLDIQELAESVMRERGYRPDNSSEFYIVRGVVMAAIARALLRGDIKVTQTVRKDGISKAR